MTPRRDRAEKVLAEMRSGPLGIQSPQRSVDIITAALQAAVEAHQRDVIDCIFEHARANAATYASLPDAEAVGAMLRYNLKALREWPAEKFGEALAEVVRARSERQP